MTNLSPQSQAVRDAYRKNWIDEQLKQDVKCLAAALRALDRQLGHEVLGVRCVDCSQIQLIAAELEAHR